MAEESDSSTIRSIGRDSISRRQAVYAVGVAVGGSASVAYAAAETARADVDVASWDVSDASIEAEQADPVVEATVEWAFRADGVSRVVIELLVAGEAVAEESLMTGAEEADGDTDLSGRVASAPAFSTADFDVATGESLEVEVPVGVRFAVLDGEAVLAEDTAERVATVEVIHPDDGSAFARVGGAATIVDDE